ncbi:TolC family protein [Prolixibacteraceae bacterium JC049]|nr:TolC family protein [Prolixibacteraceae bacterium JC049]
MLGGSRTIKLGVLGLFFCGTLYAQEKSLTFEQAAAIAFKQNPLMEQGKLQLKQREQEEKAAWGLYVPRLGLEASYVHLQKDLSIDLSPIRDAITPLYQALGNFGQFSGVPNPDPATNSVMPVLPGNVSTKVMRDKLQAGLTQVMNTNWNQTVQKQNFGRVSAQVVWPLFTGGKIKAANNVAKIRKGEASEQIRVNEAKLMSELVERYYGLCLAYEALDVRKQVLEAMNKHMSDAQKLFDEGIIAKAELLHAKLYHAQADREVKKAQRQLDIVTEALNNTLGEEKLLDIKPASRLFYMKQIEDLVYFQENANRNNAMLKQVDAKHALTKQKIKAAQAEYFPTVAATASYDLYNKNLSLLTPEAMVGVGLKWTLFDGVARTRKVKAAHLISDRVASIKEKASADISMGISKFYQDIQMQMEQLDELNTAMEFATEYVHVRNKAFSEGMATSTEVVDANLAIAKVKIERLKAIYKYDVALAHLLELSGLDDQFLTYMKSESAQFESYQKK